MRRLLAVAPALLALAAFGVPTAEAAPSAVTGQATDLSSTGVTLNGMVDAGGVDTAWFFELAPLLPAERLGTQTRVISGSGPVPVSVPVSGLAPGTTYSYSLVAVDANGAESDGENVRFATPSVAPLVTGVTQVTGSTVLLHGVVPGGSATGISYWFEYGTTTAYGSMTFPARTPPGSGLQTVSARATGLVAGTVYHYRLRVGTLVSADASFSTSGAALAATPGLIALPADGIADSLATLHASIPTGSDGTFQFEYGPTSNYGELTEPQPFTPTMNQLQVGVDGLLPAQTYHYRLLLTTTQGILASGDMTFTTDRSDFLPPGAAIRRPSCSSTGPCSLGGSAGDGGLGASGLAGVTVRVVQKTGTTCRAFTGKRFVKRSCTLAAKTFVDAWTSKGRWMLQLPSLKAGAYQVTARAVDRAGNTSEVSASVRVKG